VGQQNWHSNKALVQITSIQLGQKPQFETSALVFGCKCLGGRIVGPILPDEGREPLGDLGV
jgi:hypothetical protein